MPTLPTPITPYYGGGQVQNPANVIPTVGAPPTKLTEDKVGTLAVDNAAATIYALASKSGNVDTWVEIGSSSPLSAFPITPFVVGPAGKAGFQTIQSAITAANTAGGGMVYVQPGSYTESLTWPKGVYVCSLPPQSEDLSATFPVTITGNHTITTGVSSSVSWGTSGINFVCTGNLFTSAIATALNTSVVDCTIRATGGFIFAFPSIDPSTNSSVTITRVNVLDGGTSSVALRGSVYITDTSLAVNGVNPFILGGDSTTITSSTLAEPITCATGFIFGFSSTFNDAITVSTSNSGAANFESCYFSAAPACITFNGTAGGSITDCQLFSGATYTIDGNSSGPILITDTTFSSLTTSFVNPALSGATWGGTVQSTVFMASQALVSGITPFTGLVNGTVVTAPPASTTSTTAFGTITFATPIQNMLGYDVLISGSINITAITTSVVFVGVGPSATPTGSAITESITSADPLILGFSAYVPAGYYLALYATGASITVSSVTNVVTPV